MILNIVQQAIFKEAVPLLKKSPNAPLILHSFSNGGGLFLWHLERQLQNIMTTNNKKKNREFFSSDIDSADWDLVRERLQCGAQVFDSSPAYPDKRCVKAAINAAGIPNPVVCSLFRFAIISNYNVANFLRSVRGKSCFPNLYWNNWKNVEAFVPLQAYIYSTAGTIADSGRMDELVEARRNKVGVEDVITKVFDDSPRRVSHLTMNYMMRPTSATMIYSVRGSLFSTYQLIL